MFWIESNRLNQDSVNGNAFEVRVIWALGNLALILAKMSNKRSEGY